MDNINIVITEETQDITFHLEAVGEKGDKGDTGEPAQVVPLCDYGDYCSGTITLTAPITDYQKLYFICGNDNGLETVVATTDNNRVHKLAWDCDNAAYQWKDKTQNAIVVTLSNNTVTIVSSNVTANGIRQIYAE